MGVEKTRSWDEVAYRGGTDGERLYLEKDNFRLTSGERVIVETSDFAEVNMDDLIARHFGRYSLVGLFCRPGYRVLDFPCGSGYAASVLGRFGVDYEGRDIDGPTIEYARRHYGEKSTTFVTDDLCTPHLELGHYHVIGCIEGLEHIGISKQDFVIGKLHGALRGGGVLIVSSPENATGRSGRSKHNEYHLGELTRKDFVALLHQHFRRDEVEIVTHRERLSSGVVSTCFYGICHKYER